MCMLVHLFAACRCWQQCLEHHLDTRRAHAAAPLAAPPSVQPAGQPYLRLADCKSILMHLIRFVTDDERTGLQQQVRARGGGGGIRARGGMCGCTCAVWVHVCLPRTCHEGRRRRSSL